MDKKLVISYSDKDREIAEKVHDQLVEAGYDAWIAHKNKIIRGDVDWTQSIQNAIDSSDGLVLVWSKSAAESKHVREEIRIARVFLMPIFPLRAYPEEEIPSLPNEIENLQVIKMGSLDLNIKELKERLANPEKSDIKYKELAEHGFIPKARNPDFFGRRNELKKLFVDSRGYRGQTKIAIPIAISGLAGIGKTELALAFGYRFNLLFPEGVYWVDTPHGIVHEFGKIGPHLGVKELQDERPRDYAERVLEKLGQLREGLIIFDNITNFSEFRRWCPQGSTSCSVILTTRLSPRGFPAMVINLTELDSDSAYDLLIARRPDGAEISRDKAQRDALLEICRITGNHPLALKLCASRLESEYIKPSDYLNDIQQDPLGRLSEDKEFELLLGRGTSNLREVLFNSYESLDEELVDPYFLLMCCFGPHGINRDLITQAYEKPVEAGRALGLLDDISFIRRELSDTLSIHPLVAQFGRKVQEHKDFDYPGKFLEVMLGFLWANEDNLASEEVRKGRHHIDEALRVAQNGEFWKEYVQLHEYVAEIEVGVQEQIDSLENAYQIIEQYLPQQKWRLPGILLRLGKAHRTAGRLHEALADFNKAEVLYRGIKDVDPVEAASLRFELGDTCLAMGLYDEARKILSNALDMVESILDNSAPEILQLRQALAKYARLVGDYDTAEADLIEILDYREIFYEDHPDVTSATWLASAHAEMSQLALARTHYTDAVRAADEALRITNEYHAESDPDCSNIYLLLGTIHYQSGNYSLAEKQLEKARLDFSTTFGEGHPNYARTLIVLGEVHRKQGEFNKAEKEVESAIAIFKKVYGEIHPSVAEALDVLGKIYDHRCEFDKEQKIWEEILRIQREFYNEQHPALANSHYNYASLFLRRGQYDKAAEQLQSSLQIIEQSFGQKHVNYFGCLVRLATCRYEQQDYFEAQKVLDDAASLQHDVFGDSPHPFVARMLRLRSEVLRRLGKFDEALTVIDKAIEMKEAIYDENHPSVAEALEEKVKIYHHLGEKKEAKELIDRALEIRRGAYGQNHPEVSDSVHDLGSYYLRLGQYEEAIEQFEQARQITEAVFDESHPDYVERTLNLANAREEQGEYQLALGLVKEIKDALPEGNHYLTARWLQLMGELQRRKGQFDKAMDYINEAIEMKEAIYGTRNHPSVAEALEIKGKIYDHLGELVKEQKIWEEILKIQHQFYGEQHPALATTYHDFANLHERMGEYDKALELLGKSLVITEKSLGKTHVNYFGRLSLKAACLYDQQAYSEAQKVLDDAKALQQDIFGDSPHPFIARMLRLQSEILRRLGKFEEALTVIDEAIAMKVEIYGTENHPSVADALEVKVDLKLSQYQIKECGKFLDLLESIRYQAYGDRHPEYASYQRRRAEWFELDGEFEKARSILEKSLQTCLDAFSAEHPETIRLQIELARIARKVNDIVRAEALIDGVRETLKDRLEKEESLIVAETYEELSNLSRAKGDYSSSLMEIERVLKIKDKVFDDKAPEIIDLQSERAKLLIMFRRLSEANEIIVSAIANIETNQPRYSLLKSDLLMQLGILQGYIGKYDKALDSLEEAINLGNEYLSKENVKLARLYIEKAVVLRHQGKYANALGYLEDANNIDNHHRFDENHLYYARILLEKGQTYEKMDDVFAAQEHLNEALLIYGKQHYQNVKRHADAAEALGRIYLISDFSHAAFRRFHEAMEIRKVIYDDSHPEIAETLYNQAKALLKMSEARESDDTKAEARQKLEQALNMLHQYDYAKIELISDIESTLAEL